MIEIEGLRARLTCICEQCGARQRVDPNEKRDGQPIIRWFYLVRNELCLRCFTLSDPKANSAVAGKRDTSKRAAFDVFPRTGTHRHRILRFLASTGEHGATDEEIQEALDIHHNSQTPRRGELEQGGWIRDSGHKRRTRSGDQAIIWVLTDTARAKLAA